MSDRDLNSLTLAELAAIDPRSLPMSEWTVYSDAFRRRSSEEEAQARADENRAWNFETDEYVALPAHNGQRLAPGCKVFASIGRGGRWRGPYTVVEYKDLLLAVQYPDRKPTATETLCQRLPDPFNAYRVVG